MKWINIRYYFNNSSIGGYHDSSKVFCLNDSLQTKILFVNPKYCISFMCIIIFGQINNIVIVIAIVIG